MPSEHRYSDDEVSLILRKAADLQVQGAARAEGLTLDAIQEIAREVGIRPEVIAEAAAIVARGGPDATEIARSSTDKFRLELFSPGEPTDEELADLPSVIRKVMEHQGKVSGVLGSIEWATVGQPSQVAVVIRKTPNGTRIEVVADRSGAAVLTLVPTTIGGFLLGAIAGAIIEPGVAGGVALIAGGIGSGAAVGWTIWRRNTARFKQKMLRLAEALREALRRP